MAKTEASAETFKRAAQERIALCRASLATGNAELEGLEESVRDYCLAVAALPKAEAQAQVQELEALMQEVEALGKELVEAREAVRSELSGLGRMKQANVAYHRSDSIGPIHRPKKEED